MIALGMDITRCLRCCCRRQGKDEVKLTLEVELDSQPPIFDLSVQLVPLVGPRQATRTAVLNTLWAYIRLHKLQVSWSASYPECVRHPPQELDLDRAGSGLSLRNPRQPLHGMQEANGLIRCEGQMQNLFQERHVAMSSLSQRIDAHLTKPKPHCLEYTVR